MKLILVCCLLFSLPTFARGDKLRFLTVEYCPLVCKGNKGLAIDLANKLSKRAGYKIDVKVASIKRAFELLKTSKEFHGIILGSKDHVPNTVFMKNPIFTQHIRIFSRKDLNWKYTGVQSLNNLKVAVIKNFHYNDKELMNYLKNSPNVNKLFHSDSLPTLIKMLDLKRIDVFIAGDIVAKYHLKNFNKINEFNISDKSLGQYENYISFSKNAKDVNLIKKKFDEAFIKLKRKDLSNGF